MDFRILGQLEVRGQTGGICTFVRRKQRLLLAALLLNANQPVPIERIADWLWGERLPTLPAQNLYNYVSGLRRQLDNGHREDTRVQACSSKYLLRVEPGELDADVFERLVDQGRRAADEGEHTVAVERLSQALSLWRGNAVLDGLALPETLRAEAIRLETLHTVALETAFDARLALGQHGALVPELKTAVHRHPLHERLWAQLMLALYRSGRQAEALVVYRQAKDTLVSELGVDPGSELQQLHQEILRADPSIAGPTVPTAKRPVPAQLPASLSTFTGRDIELSQLLSLTAGERTVVNAIDGMAGIGKTALAVEFAHQVADRFSDGQLFIDLHGITKGVSPVDACDALDRMLRAMGVSSGQVPQSVDERSALWRTLLANRHVLIVLDNAATEEQVRPLLPASTGCLVLITSRRRLAGLDNMHPIFLDVLPLPDAITLFARIVGPGRLAGQPAERIAEVVDLCDRLPLAVRVAAARLRDRPTWTLADLADRLRDQQQRLAVLERGHRSSVTAALQLSYVHLPDDHQRVFRLLGLHPGPDIELYGVAALANLTPRRASRILDDLHDAHLLQQHQPGRYRFHDLVRVYAAQTCAEDESEPEGDPLTRLFDYYTITASAASEQLYLPEVDHQPPASAAGTFALTFGEADKAATWLDAELDNLLAIPAHGLPAHALHLSAALHRHLRARDKHTDAEALHAQALRIARQVGDRRGEYNALTGLGHAFSGSGAHTQAVSCFERALEIAHDIGLRNGACHAVTSLANLHRLRGDSELAAECFEQALSIARDISYSVGEIGALAGLGYLNQMLGRYEAAVKRFEQALVIARDVNDRSDELIALNGLGGAYRMQGRYQLAADCYQQTLVTSRRIRDPARELGALCGLGKVHRSQGNYAKAAECLQEVLNSASDVDKRNTQLEAWHELGYLHSADGRPEQALDHHQRALDLASELEQPTDKARVHHGLATARYALGDYQQAREHWQQALHILVELGIPQSEEVSVDEVRAQLAGLDPLLDDRS